MRQGTTFYRLGGSLRKTSLPLADAAKPSVDMGQASNVAGLTMDSRLSKPSPADTGNVTPMSLRDRPNKRQVAGGRKESTGPAHELFADSETAHPHFSNTAYRKRERLS